MSDNKRRTQAGDKGKNPEYSQVAVYVLNGVHTKLKMIALHRGVAMRDIVEGLIDDYVETEYDKVAHEMLSETI